MLSVEIPKNQLVILPKWKMLVVRVLDRLKPVEIEYSSLLDNLKKLRETFYDEVSMQNEVKLYEEIDRLIKKEVYLSPEEKTAIRCFERATVVSEKKVSVDGLIYQLEDGNPQGVSYLLWHSLYAVREFINEFDGLYKDRIKIHNSTLELLKEICLLDLPSFDYGDQYYVETGEYIGDATMLSTLSDSNSSLDHLRYLSIRLISFIRKKDFSNASMLLKENPKLSDFIKNSIHDDGRIYDEIFNKEIIVVIDTGKETFDAGHAFIGYQTHNGSMVWRGFHPYEEGKGQLYGLGGTEDDIMRLNNFHVRQHIRITEEGWDKVNTVIKNYDDKKVVDTYSFFGIPFTGIGNCCHFVNNVLLLAGIPQGLMGIFSFQDLNNLHEGKSFSLVKSHLAWNYILDRPSPDDPERDDTTNITMNDLLAQRVNETKEKAEREKRALAVNNLLGLVPVSPSPALTFSLAGNLHSVQHHMNLTRNMDHLSPALRNDVMARLEESLRQIQRFKGGSASSGLNESSADKMGL